MMVAPMVDERDHRSDESEEDAPEHDAGFDLDGPVEDLPRGTTLGRYVLLGRVGEGAMGVVYAAFDPDLDRKVAIKLVRLDMLGDPESFETNRLRLLREAQAIAKVSHPCVVQVHDVGTFGDDGDGQALVFIAMEFVDGINLRQWMEARDDPFPWREVVRVFREAGRGLAAAHAAGVVHRDFKPENVLLGKGQRICVLDFGLAMQVEERDDAPDIDVDVSALRESFPSLLASVDDNEELTQVGAVVGTPAYMSPEQHVGGRADPRSDQFSFCVAMYEVLYGERPFAGNRRIALGLEVMQGRVRPPPERSDVPAWLREVLVRGLSTRPSERYPSMDALVRELDYDPAASRRRWLIGLGMLGVLGVGVAGIAYKADAESRLCRGGEQHLSGIWDPERRATLREAFMRTGRVDAEDSWALVESEVDTWIEGWLGMWRDACAATRIRGEASESLLDQRMTCLDARLGEVAALGRVLESNTSAVLENAHGAAGRLTPARVCGRSDGLREYMPPADAIADRVAELRTEHDELWVLHRAGAGEQVWSRGEALLQGLDSVDYPPLRASTHLLLGEVGQTLGKLEAAEDHLHEAAMRASAADFQRVAARAWIELSSTIARSPERFAEAERWAAYAQSIITRTNDDGLRAILLTKRADVARASGRAGDALGLYHEALALTERLHGPRDVRAAGILTSLGILMAVQGEHASAEGYFERALEIHREQQGPNHPQVATALMNLGNVQYSQHRFDEALANYERSLAIKQRVHGPDDPAVATSLVNLAAVRRERDEPAVALEMYQRAARIFEAVYGPEAAQLGYALHGLGRTRLDLGQPELAREALERAVKIRLEDASDPTNLAESREALAEALWFEQDERDRALELARAARDAYADAGGGERHHRVQDWIAERERR